MAYEGGVVMGGPCMVLEWCRMGGEGGEEDPESEGMGACWASVPRWTAIFPRFQHQPVALTAQPEGVEGEGREGGRCRLTEERER